MSEAEKALAALEEVAKQGREAWKDLAERIEGSKYAKEIKDWLYDIGQDNV